MLGDTMALVDKLSARKIFPKIEVLYPLSAFQNLSISEFSKFFALFIQKEKRKLYRAIHFWGGLRRVREGWELFGVGPTGGIFFLTECFWKRKR